MKIRPVGVKKFHADRRTDGNDEGISRFSKFCELALKEETIHKTSPKKNSHISFTGEEKMVPFYILQML